MPEKRSSRIIRGERDELIEVVGKHALDTLNYMRERRNFNSSRRYIGLIALLRTVQLSPDMKTRQKTHARKMIGLEAISIPEKPRRPKGAAKMWQIAQEEAGAEIAAAQFYASDPDNMPRPYRDANRDLEQVRELISNPLMLELQLTLKSALGEQR